MDEKLRQEKETKVAAQCIGLVFGFVVFIITTVFCFFIVCFTFDDPNSAYSIMAWIIRGALFIPPIWTAVEFCKMLNKAQSTWQSLQPKRDLQSSGPLPKDAPAENSSSDETKPGDS